MNLRRLLPLIVLMVNCPHGQAAEPRYAGKPLAFWLQELSGDDPLIREEAIEVLADAGPAAREAVPRLEALAKDPQLSVRLRAGLALWRIAGRKKPAIAALAEALQDPATPDRARLAATLADFGPDALSAAPTLLALMGDADRAVAWNAVAHLQKLGAGVVPVLGAALDDKDQRRRGHAAEALARLGVFANEARPALRKHLEDEDRDVRFACARGLWGQGQTTDTIAAVLLEAARNGDDAQRRGVLDTLAATTRPRIVAPVLRELLQRGDPLSRARAANLLWDLDPQPKLVLPIYLEAIKSPDIGTRMQATQGLGRMGPAAAEAVPGLMAVLKSPTGPFINDVYDALAAIGKPAAPPLVELLTADKPDPRIAIQVTNTLGRIGGPAVPAVMPLLAHADAGTRLRGCQIVAAIGPAAAAAVPKLTPLLKDDDARVRRAAVDALSRIGPAAKTAAPMLLEQAKASEVNVRAAALQALTLIRPESREVRTAALDALEDDNPLIRCRGVILLHSIAPKHPDILPHVLELLKQPVGRSELLVLLDRMGPAGARAVPALTKLLTQSDANQCRMIIQVLGRIGPAARPAVPALLEQLRSPDYTTRQSVLIALQSIGSDDPARVVPALVEAARKDSTGNRTFYLQLLGNFGAKASAAVPWIIDELHRPPNYVTIPAAETLHRIDPERACKEALPVLQAMLTPSSPQRVQAAAALVRIKPDSKEALDALVGCLQGADTNARQQAGQALGMLGPAARAAAPALRRALQEPTVSVRVSVAGALFRVTGDTAATIPVLTEALKAKTAANYTRYAAALQLGNMGTAARAALPELLKLRNDPDALVRNGVQIAITRINGTLPAPAAPPDK